MAAPIECVNCGHLVLYRGESACAICACTNHAPCDFDHPHPDHPCGRAVVDGVTRCSVCGELDDSPECEANGCWRPATQADLDELIVEGMEGRI